MTRSEFDQSSALIEEYHRIIEAGRDITTRQRLLRKKGVEEKPKSSEEPHEHQTYLEEED